MTIAAHESGLIRNWILDRLFKIAFALLRKTKRVEGLFSASLESAIQSLRLTN
jgi:hypothetical protein